MSGYKVSELKEDSVEGLIAKLVYNSVSMAHRGGGTKVEVQNEQRIIKELSTRIGIDAEVLLEKISK